MLAYLQRALQRWAIHAVPAVLWTAFGTVHSQILPLHERLVQIEEVARITPQRALQQLSQLKFEVQRGTPAEQSEFLIASSDAQHGLGKHAEAIALCEQAIVIGRRTANNDIVARALLSKAYAMFSLEQVAASHQLIWEAEKLGGATNNVRLRVLILISSGESSAEEGNLALALGKVQSATTVARDSGDPLLVVISLRSLARLYDQMREYEKGFELLDEALRAAKRANSPGRLALLKSTEYALAMDSNQIHRALNAELSAMQL